MKKVDRWKMEMPTEQEMLPKDKYTVFDRKVKRYRKGIHSELFFYFTAIIRMVEANIRFRSEGLRFDDREAVNLDRC